jgi:phosphoenolpyruvate carboxykinase (ATP)
MKLRYTRAMLHAALSGKLDEVPTEKDPVFGLEIPLECPDVPSEILRPRDTWTDPSAYDAQAAKLAQMFKDNFEKYADQVPEEVRAAGPR